MVKFHVSRLKVSLLFLATLLLFQSISCAQEDIENETEPKLKEVGSVFSTVEQFLKEDTEHQTEVLQPDDVREETTLPQNEETEVVQTTGGPVVGSTQKSFDGVEVSVYYGIPYAAAPVGPLRFRPPVKVSPWKKPFVAKLPLPLCYQELIKVKGMEMISSLLGRPWTEDCLTVSVWAPKPKAQGAPVLVNIHGGGFLLGSPVLMIDGATMASRGVVVVSLSYRLGVFGFFSLGHANAPGNFGLMDQTLALRWVQENAVAFGGDPSRVTLMGQSSGSACVGYHLLSPMSSGLFSAAIVLGGAPTNPWAIKEAEKAVQKSIELLEAIGCGNSNVTLSMNCIQEKSADRIAELAVTPDVLTPESFIPTVDGQFITEHPEVYLEAGRIANPVPVIIGTAEFEGSHLLSIKLVSKDGRVFRQEFQNLIHQLDKKLTPLQVKGLDVLYTNWSNPEDPFLLRDALRDLYGDYTFNCGVNKLTDALAMVGSNVYRYVFGHALKFGPLQPESWMGATHGSDFLTVLGPLMPQALNVEDAQVVEEFQQRVINFLRTRNPNQGPEETTEDVLWPQYNLRNRSYLHVSVDSHVKTGHRTRECRILEELIPVLASVDKGC